jgi:predicted GIY-YIG superfamily endonuclease
VNGKRTDGPPERTALYRIHGEADALLYIGISHRVPLRWNQHQVVQPWWDELRSLTVEWYDSREEAEEAESAAIEAEMPKYNRTYLVPREPRKVWPKPITGPPFEPLTLAEPPEDAMTPADLAQYVRTPEQTLAGWRKRRTGPPYVLVGGEVLYSREVVEEWFKCLPSGGGQRVSPRELRYNVAWVPDDEAQDEAS